MKIFSWRVVFAVVLATSMAVPVYGQATEHEKHHPEAAEEKVKTPKTMPMGMMMERCKTMMSQMQQIHQQKQRMDSKLQGLVDEMNSSTGEAKISAIAATVNELATHRRNMHQSQNEMHGKMMAHMMEHMVPGMKEETGSQMMMQCPMMKMMGGADHGEQDEGSDLKKHEGHDPEEQ